MIQGLTTCDARGFGMRSEKISVCMATYNGAKYIAAQIDSILQQLLAEDELIIVDDHSTDSTVDIIRNFKDPRIKWTVNEKNIGVNRSFEKAISLSGNAYIFMADQDDIWHKDRVAKMLDILKRDKVSLESGNSLFIDANGEETTYPIPPLKESDSGRTFKNLRGIFLGKASYYGCTMAFKSELKKVILPFPKNIESHDLWIAKAAILQKRNYHTEDIVLHRRVHGGNASIIERSMGKKIRSRFIFLESMLRLIIRNWKNKGKKGADT